MAETNKTTKTTATSKNTSTKATATKTTKSTAAKSTTAKKTTAKAVAPKAVENTATKTVAKATTTKKATTVAPKGSVAPAKAKAEPKKTIRVTLIKSTIGFNKNQAKVVRSLGLNKLHSTNVIADNACTRGMIAKISHLLKVEEM